MKPMERYNFERRQNREMREDTILNAAERLFAKKGIENTTMQDIADEANLGVATVFRLFQKKERIIVTVATRKLERILEIFQNIADMDITCFEKIERLLDHLMQNYYPDKNEAVKILENFETYASRITDEMEDFDLYKSVYREISRTFSKIIEDGLRDGSIRSDINIKETLITLVNAGATFSRKLTLQKSIFFIELDLEPEKQAALLKKIILDYLRPTKQME